MAGGGADVHLLLVVHIIIIIIIIIISVIIISVVTVIIAILPTPPPALHPRRVRGEAHMPTEGEGPGGGRENADDDRDD